MAGTADATKIQDQHCHIQTALVTQLTKLREQCPEHFSTPIHVLSAVDDSIEGQFQQILQQEGRDHTGERIVLIPYQLENSHWIGMMIKFQANGQITTVEYIDPVTGINTIPNRVQDRFAQIYPNMAIQSRDMLKDDDPRCSIVLTMKNLLAAAGNIRLLKELNRVNDGNDVEKEMKVFWDEICNPNDERIHELEEKLRLGLTKFHFKDATVLPGEMQETQERIKKLEQQRRIEMAQAEMKFFNELRELNELAEQISALKSIPQTPGISSIEVDNIPICAERTLIELRLQLKGGISSQQKDFVRAALHTLKDQLKNEELLSETNRTILQNLEICISSNDSSSTVRFVEELWKQIRPLNIPEIRRLIEKSKNAADLIRGKEIILLVGETGTGKSTTIQFLAGSTMEVTRVEITPGKFLEHITAVGPIKNPQLNNVISSPLSRSETRYIIPVTIPLQDILGSHETDVITVCDAPGFDDTAGAEVDIANSIGIIEALKGTKSVKILALSSYKSLGDRGQGIEKLANILSSMVYRIEDKLDSILYAFTKYPETMNINALLEDLNTSRSASTSVAVLCDMIEKTEDVVYRIDPIHGDPKVLIKKLRRMRGIAYPGEVFRLSMSEKTRASIVQQVQKDKLSIIYAMNRRDIELISYYLNDLKILNDLIKENIVQNTYKDSIRYVSEKISEYCTNVIEKFNRALTSQDGLSEKDILEYKTSVNYLAQAQILKDHEECSFPTPDSLIQNMISQLQEKQYTLEKEELHSVLVRIYFDNLCMLKNSFEELETYYCSSGKEFEKRFEELVQSARDPILSNDFTHLAETFQKISRSLSILKVHLGEQIEVKYRDIIQFLVRHLHSVSKEADTVLVKIRLTDNDIEILKKDIAILKSAKENALLQKCVAIKDLTDIYEEFLEKINTYFHNITARIGEILNTNGAHALEDVEKLVNDMNTFRELPELKSKTAQKYHQTVEHIRGYIHQLQTNAEQSFISLQQQPSKTVNYKQLERLVSRLKDAEWINGILPGTHDTIMHCLTDEFVEYAQQLENALKKLDLSWKCPDNIAVGLEIIEKIEAASILERSIPELEEYRTGISQHFQQCVQEVFDRISKVFTIQAEERIKLDAATANNALIYLSQCEKVSYYQISESASHSHEHLHRHISEYGHFLNQEIGRIFKHICHMNEDVSQYSHELETYVNELSSLSKFEHVFQCIEGKEKIEHWHREFLDCYRTLTANLEDYICFHKNKELREQLIVVQALSSVDRFCVTIFNNQGFGALYRHYQIEMTRAAKEAFKTVLDYLSKGDYAKADIMLHDIDKDLLNAKDLSQLKYDVENSLNQLMKKTNSIVIWLDGKIEREKNNQDQIKEIKENVDKIRIALNKSNLMDLLHDEIRAHLQNFDNEINEILSGILLKGFSAIEVYIDTDHFLEADQGLENLNRIQRDLTGYCTSSRVTEKSEELIERLNSTVTNILKREEITNIDNYSLHPPKELLDRLKMLVQHGNAKYNQVYSSILTVIKQNFSLAIEKAARVTPLNERYNKIRSLNHAWHFLPEDLQIHFKLPMDDLNKLIVNDEFEMTSELEKIINQLDRELIDNGKIQFEEELHEKSRKILSIIKAQNSDCKDTLPPTLNIEKLEERLKKKNDDCGNQLISTASKTELTTRDSDYFRLCYNYLSLFDENILNVFKEKIFERMRFLCESITTAISDVARVAELLIKLKYFGEKLPIFDYQTDSEIGKILYIFKEHENHTRIKQLIMVLNRSDIGRRLVNTCHYLNEEDWRNRWEKMQNQHHLEYVLGNLYGDQVDRSTLAAYYLSFEQIYKSIIARFSSSLNSMRDIEADLEALSSQIKTMGSVLLRNLIAGTWDHRIIDGIVQLIAHLFALWTLKHTHYYTAIRPYLLIPHVAQVIAVFRLLGIDSAVHTPIAGSHNLLVNNLIEIGTGEGKSVVLAIAACVFALIGFDVNCSSYKNTFSSVFRALDLEKRITYSTFHRLCEELVNEQCDVREKVRDMILNNKTTIAVDQVKSRTRRKVLLIDEVDVFLSEKFYGGLYTPAVVVKSDSIRMLFDAIWQSKALKSLSSVQTLVEYKACVKKYSHWIFLVDEAIKNMLAALQSYQSSTYIVQNDKIVYVEGESIVENVVRGYDTMWAYYHEHEKGHISQSSLESNVGLIVNCGTFSYAEIPHDFSYIAGVTGTLRTLIQPEKDILKRVYAIQRNTYIPSVFGKSNCTFNPATDVHIVKESDYFIRIQAEIDSICKANRAILVFFESEEKLMAFYHSAAFSSMKQDVQIITEKVSIQERELCIERATIMSRVTLLTRVFGRGLDFICRDRELLANGGIHVLQTFFSETLSEEYQIMGRGARQGDPGSYSMILLDQDLEWIFGSTWREELSQISGTPLYAALNKARNKHHEIKCVIKHRNIEQCRLEHRSSLDFLFALCTGEMNTLKRFLSKQNPEASSLAHVRLQFTS